MTDDVVLCEVDERGIATVTLNRPEVNNAYNTDVIVALSEAIGVCAGDDSVRCIVIRGNGRHFQAGADLNWLKEIGKQSAEENLAVSERTAMAVQGLNTVPIPTIALVHGGCFGGGTGIVSACDIVIASDDAMFAITEARWGVMAGIIIPHLVSAIGARHVRRYALTCERFSAAKAKALGLVHEVCEYGQLDDTAAPIIDNLLLSAPDATARTKQRTLQYAGLLIESDEFDQLIAEHSIKRRSDEAHEGLDSFIEKRRPSWYPS